MFSVVTKKLCAYCGEPCSLRSKDHIVAKCLWEKRHRPQHLKTVPACRRCNESFSEDETYFRTVLLATLPDDEMTPNARSVVDGAFLRSIENGKLNIRDIRSSVCWKPMLSPAGLYLGHHPTIQVDLHRVNRVIGKMVKGFYCYKNKHPLPRSYVVAVWEGNSFWHEYESVVGQMRKFEGFGDPDFQASFLRSQEDLNRTYHLYIFYRSLSFFAATIPAAFFGIEPSQTKFDQTVPLRLKK